jgi:hypothetical protein
LDRPKFDRVRQLFNIRYRSEENKFKKWFGKPELAMTLFSLIALRLGLDFSYFLMTLLAPLFVLFLANTAPLA